HAVAADRLSAGYLVRAEDGARGLTVPEVRACALAIWLRRAAAGARTPETVRPAAVRVARVLPSPVRVQRAGARPRRGRGQARRRARRALERRRLGRDGARAGRSQA